MKSKCEYCDLPYPYVCETEEERDKCREYRIHVFIEKMKARLKAINWKNAREVL